MICFYDDDHITIIEKTIPYNDICPICLDELLFQQSSDENKMDTIILRCGHGYHKDCIYHMLDYGEEKCGICRKYVMFPKHSLFIICLFSFCRGIFSSHEKILLLCLTLYFSFTGILFLFLVSDCVTISNQQSQQRYSAINNVSCIECLQRLLNNSRMEIL